MSHRKDNAKIYKTCFNRPAAIIVSCIAFPGQERELSVQEHIFQFMINLFNSKAAQIKTAELYQTQEKHSQIKCANFQFKLRHGGPISNQENYFQFKCIVLTKIVTNLGH